MVDTLARYGPVLESIVLSASTFQTPDRVQANRAAASQSQPQSQPQCAAVYFAANGVFLKLRRNITAGIGPQNVTNPNVNVAASAAAGGMPTSQDRHQHHHGHSRIGKQTHFGPNFYRDCSLPHALRCNNRSERLCDLDQKCVTVLDLHVCKNLLGEGHNN